MGQERLCPLPGTAFTVVFGATWKVAVYKANRHIRERPVIGSILVESPNCILGLALDPKESRIRANISLHRIVFPARSFRGNHLHASYRSIARTEALVFADVVPCSNQQRSAVGAAPTPSRQATEPASGL